VAHQDLGLGGLGEGLGLGSTKGLKITENLLERGHGNYFEVRLVRVTCSRDVTTTIGHEKVLRPGAMHRDGLLLHATHGTNVALSVDGAGHGDDVVTGQRAAT
jgi:hypothetical protein